MSSGAGVSETEQDRHARARLVTRCSVAAIIAPILLGVWANYRFGGSPTGRAASDRCLWGILSGESFLGATSVMAAESVTTVTFRILLGVGDRDPSKWDGSLEVSKGKVTSIQGWRFTGDDLSDYQSSWKAASRQIFLGGPARAGRRTKAIIENGVLVTAELPEGRGRFDVKTSNGSFSFSAEEFRLGEGATFLGGRVSVDRVPSTQQLTESDDDEDDPVLAQGEYGTFIAYVLYSHGDRSQVPPAQLLEPLRDFSVLAYAGGGDQVMLLHRPAGASEWEEALPVSAPSQKVTRVAMATDKDGRTWVIWSAQKKQNFNLYGRYWKSGRLSPEFLLNSASGANLNPVAVADRAGRVWIAWQAFRDGRLKIVASALDGESLEKEVTVSTSSQNNWDPTIAASPNGDVAIAWDTYDKGDYDVLVRRLRKGSESPSQPNVSATDGGTKIAEPQRPGIQIDEPVGIAETALFEARPSIAIDVQNRIWVAYETAPPSWGKNFGAYDSSGLPLYAAHRVAVRMLDGTRLLQVPDPFNPLPATAPGSGFGVNQRRRPSDQVPTGRPIASPASGAASNGTPRAALQVPAQTQTALPRITIDPAGNLFLAFRTEGLAWLSSVGPVWFENLLTFNGERWSPPLFLPHTDGGLDNRPSLLAPQTGHLLVATSMDHRQSLPQGRGRRNVTAINADLYSADVDFGKTLVHTEATLTEVSKAAGAGSLRKSLPLAVPPTVHGPSGDLILLQGDLQRHTELSTDGVRDGSLEDAYRYALDAAALNWMACCDLENLNHTYAWWLAQKWNEAYNLPGRFSTLFASERDAAFPQGHRMIIFAKPGIRPLPHLPQVLNHAETGAAPDTQMLDRYLAFFGGIAAMLTPATEMGTDWRDCNPQAEPLAEIYQGAGQSYEMHGSPRAPGDGDFIGGYRPQGFLSEALKKGCLVGFVAGSGRSSNHLAFTGVWAGKNTRDAVFEALRRRHVYASTAPVVADVRMGDHLMGEEFQWNGPRIFMIHISADAPIANVTLVRDRDQIRLLEGAANGNPNQWSSVWRDENPPAQESSYYYVRAELADGNLVWTSPMWIHRNAVKAEALK